MPTYISLLNFTQQGAHNIKESPAQLDNAKEFVKSMGAELKQYFLVMGKYDTIAVVEAPDDETVAKITMAVASYGNVRTQTFRAFTEDEYRALVAALPQTAADTEGQIGDI